MSKCCNANINYIESGAGLSTDSSGKFWADCENLTDKCEEVKLTEKTGVDSIVDAELGEVLRLPVISCFM